jgi:outer membrane protein assembly factor BamD
MKFIKIFPLLLAFSFFYCSSSSELELRNSRDRFELAKKYYFDNNYTKAIENLRIISYEKGVEYADSVQYILADCYFKTKQYILAAYEFQDLVRFTPTSKLVPMARYMVGLSYSNIVPSSSLDQSFTNRAIIELQAYLEYFPTHENARDAEKLLIELRNKLAEKEYNTAILYTKMSRFRSAIIYFNIVLERFHDSSYADLAQLGIIRSYLNMGRGSLAKAEIDKFLIKYPNSSRRGEVTRLKESL